MKNWEKLLIGETHNLFLKKTHHKKDTKYNFLKYQLQFSKAYQFIKLNEEEGFNDNIH